MLLAGLILKLGGFGILRFVILLFPLESHTFKFYVIALCCIGYTFATFAAIRQLDIKRFIAFTSIAHMNFSLGALFTMHKMGFMAFFHTMISHGFIATGLFFLVGFVYSQVGSRDLLHVRGLASTSPVFSVYWFIFSMANAGMPMLSGFPGEFFGLASLSSVNFFMVFWFGIGFYFTAVYIFINVTHMLFGTPSPISAGFLDLDRSSHSSIAYLLVFVVLFGVCPDLVFSTLSDSSAPSLGFCTIADQNSIPVAEVLHMFHWTYAHNMTGAQWLERHTLKCFSQLEPIMPRRPNILIITHVVPNKYYSHMVGPVHSRKGNLLVSL